MSLPAAMQAVQDTPVLRLFYALEIDLPASPAMAAHNLCLLEGSGVISWGGKTFLGADGEYGTWMGCEAVGEQLATEPPKFTVTLGPLTDEAMQQIGQPQAQGAPVYIYSGYLDPLYAQPVCTPETVWTGCLDIGNIELDRNKRTIAVDIYCAAELMLLADDGSKLTSTYHNQFYPNEQGFQFVDSVTHPVPWGAKGPRPDQAISGANYATAQNSSAKTTLKF